MQLLLHRQTVRLQYPVAAETIKGDSMLQAQTIARTTMTCNGAVALAAAAGNAAAAASGICIMLLMHELS
jgi:hypothetical protein